MSGKSSKTVMVMVRLLRSDMEIIKQKVADSARYQTISGYLKEIIHHEITKKRKKVIADDMGNAIAIENLQPKQSVNQEEVQLILNRVSSYIQKANLIIEPSKKAHFSSAVIRDVFRRDNGKCIYCGRPAQQVDHVISGKYGGPNIRSNAVCACISCNCSKGQHPENMDFLARAMYWLLGKGEDISWVDNFPVVLRVR